MAEEAKPSDSTLKQWKMMTTELFFVSFILMYMPELHIKVSSDWSTASATLLFEQGEQFRVRSLRNKTDVSRIS